MVNLHHFLAESATPEEAAALTAHLVSLRSYPGEEEACQRAVAAWLEAEGMRADLQPTAQPGRPNVVARLENGPGPTLLLNGHVDTVLAAAGWSRDPWQGWRDGDRLYGLGAADMKAGVAANMLAARALYRRRDLWRGTLLFTSVVDEEAYSIGARALVESGVQAAACIVTEPFHDPVIGAVGKVLVRGEVLGRAAHGSAPELGVNAAVEAAKLIARLEEMPLGRHPHLKATQSVLSLQSGNAQYVITVPERAVFTINRHIVPGEDDETVLAEMRALAASLKSPARFAFFIDPPYYPPYDQPPDHPMLQRFAAAYAAELGRPPAYGWGRSVADANYFAAELGIPTLWFGPVGDRLHQSDEWVDIPSIAATVRVILRYALEVLR